MAVNETVALNVTADTRTLRTQLREATQDFLKLQQSGSATATEINNAAKRAAELKERISDAKDTIAAFNPEAKFKAFGQVIQGVAGAFAATQGALALVGVEGEEVQKTLVKVQGALALSEGLNTVLGLQDAFGNLSNRVKESSLFIGANSVVTNVAGKIFKIFGLEVATTSVAFRGLKTAIAATGIGLLVIALGEAVSAFQAFANRAEDAKKAQEELNKAVIKGAQTQIEGEKDYLKRQEENDLARAKRKGATEAELFAITDKFARLNINSQERFAKEIQGKGKEADDAEKELKNLKSKRDTDLINFQTNQIVKAREAQLKATQENLAKIAQEEEAFAAENEKRIARLFELQKQGLDETDTKLFNLKTQYEQDIKLFSDNEVLKARLTEQYEEERFRIKRDSVKKDEKAGEAEFKKFEKRTEKENNSRLKLENILNKKLTTSIKEQSEEQVTIKKLTEDQKLNIISQAFQTAIKLAGEGTVVGKALAIADATINTYVGASRALKDYPAPFSFIAAATTIAQGLLTVNSIINTKVPSDAGVSDSSGGASIPGAGAGAPIAPRAVEPTPTTLDQTSLNSINNVTTRAYVVESDITGSQQRISRIEKASRF
jgi:hypothetical protein